MSKEIKFRRGTTAQHATFTGAEGEVTVDTVTHWMHVHDGVTVGGHAIPTKAEIDAVQSQVDILVVNGDSSVEAAQARVQADGTTHSTLKARLDDGDEPVSNQLGKPGKITSLTIRGATNASGGRLIHAKPRSVYVRGTNLFNGDWNYGKVISSETGLLLTNVSHKTCKDYIRVPPNMQITISGTGYSRMVEYDESLNFVAYWPNVTRTITTSANTRYIRFGFTAESSGADAQVQFGGVQKTLEPYDSRIYDLVNIINRVYLTTDGRLILRSIGDVADEWNALSGALTRNIAEATEVTGNSYTVATGKDGGAWISSDGQSGIISGIAITPSAAFDNTTIAYELATPAVTYLPAIDSRPIICQHGNVVVYADDPSAIIAATSADLSVMEVRVALQGAYAIASRVAALEEALDQLM